MWEISEITTLHNFVHLIKVNQQHMWILLEPQTLLEVIKFHIFQFLLRIVWCGLQKYLIQELKWMQICLLGYCRPS